MDKANNTMDSLKQALYIEGLGGQKKLEGSIKICGAKNAALKAMAASVLFDGEVVLQNVPDTDDIKTMSKVLTKLGAKVSDLKDGIISIDASGNLGTDIDSSLAKTMRASVVLTGPLLSRFGHVTFPAPGGCVIGARPIDLFIDGYAKMGAVTSEDKSSYKMNAASSLRGTNIVFSKVSVGATETLMMAAVLAEGTTVLENCAMEPEIVNVADWLNECGADISGQGTPIMKINGTAGKLLRPKKYTAIPDRIEAGSYLLLGALTAKNLRIENCNPHHLDSTISLLKNSGVKIESGTNYVQIKDNTVSNSELKSFNVKTHEYPGFPTDLQAQITTYLSQVSGESLVQETIFEGRFKYVADLVRLGAKITEMNPHEILVKGPSVLYSLPDDEELSAHDIRAGFAIVMAALVANGSFKIKNLHLIDRGYQEIEKKLSSIGASVKRI